MRCVWGFQDIDSCPECDTINVDGTWLGSSLVSKKAKGQFVEGVDSDTVLARGDFDLEYDYDYKQALDSTLDPSDLPSLVEERSSLLPRASGVATIPGKDVTVCNNVKLYLTQPYSYPAFPSDAGFPWDGIQNGKWDSIPRYYGNSSDVCSDWGPFAKPTADIVYTGTQPFRADYQSKSLQASLMALHPTNENSFSGTCA